MGFVFYPKNAILFQHGDPGDFFFITLYGNVDLYLPNPLVKPLIEQMDLIRQQMAELEEKI